MGRVTVAFLALAGIACRENGVAGPDGSSDGGKLDVRSTLTVDIAVTGCSSYDPAGSCHPDGGTASCCTGRPPLTLSLAPIGSPELTRFLWTFGDGTPTSTERAPSHAYQHPGIYQVMLIGGTNDDGSVSPPRPLFVVVESLAAGAACDVDIQCGSGLTCLCAPGSGCSPAFVHGVCSRACDTEACAAGTVCAAAAIAPPPDGGTGARAPLCLAACQTNAQCAPGFVCQALPAAGSSTATSAWTRGCLPLGVARDVGAPCRDANEVLAADTCTTGVCADVGALGACSATCDDGRPCPDGAACATLSDGRQLCLRPCPASGDCGPDPLLACEVLGSMSGPTICAPKRCTGDTTCAPSGRCGPDAVCVRR